MANWKYVKIGDVCTVERGGSPRPIDKFITDDPNGINWIKIGDTDDSMYITKTAQKIIPEGMKKSRYVQPGDFLLSNSMSFGRPYILKIDGCIHDGWLVLRDNDGIFDKRFLYYYLSAPSTYQKFKNMAVGGVVNNLNSEMVRGVTVPVPTMEEQLNIVVTLDKVTELIALRKEQLAKLDQLVKSRFIELFGATSAENCTKQIKDYAEVLGGYAFKSDLFCADAIPVIRISNINNGCVELDYNICFDELFWEQNKRFRVEQNDVLMAMSGATTGKAGIYRENMPALINQRVACIRAKDGVACPTFLFVATQLEWMYDLIQETSAGCAQPNISGKQIENMPVPDASYEQQQQFASFVEQTDKSKFEIQKSLEKLETLKKALMQKYFG